MVAVENLPRDFGKVLGFEPEIVAEDAADLSKIHIVVANGTTAPGRPNPGRFRVTPRMGRSTVPRRLLQGAGRGCS